MADAAKSGRGDRIHDAPAGRGVRIVVSDIDGTLTDEQGRLSNAAVEELVCLERRGVRVGLTSGRPYAVVRALGEYLGLGGPMIAENGGVTCFEGQVSMLGSKREADHASVAAAKVLPLRVCWDSHARLTDCTFDMGVSADSVRAALTANNIQAEVAASSIMLHIAKAGVNKANGLRSWLIANAYHASEVLVVGDSGTDISMFEMFPLSLAPGNASATVWSLAQFRTATPYGLGIAKALAELGKRGWFP